MRSGEREGTRRTDHSVDFHLQQGGILRQSLREQCNAFRRHLVVALARWVYVYYVCMRVCIYVGVHSYPSRRLMVGCCLYQVHMRDGLVLLHNL